ncbi:hypothetical protein ADK43_37730 [Streptomyces rimosus subsp. rimosus]|nr:hypothetical protein ADK43_37730 [Streptomyces rimosus subsp. rimosus]
MAARSASTLPFRRSVNGMLYVADAPSSLCRNHSRRCANDRGSRSGRAIGVSAARRSPSPASAPRRRASAAGVGCSNTSLIGGSAPSTPRMRTSSRIADSEWPPSAKKSSCGPT